MSAVGHHIAQAYMALPEIPYGETVSILGFGPFNFSPQAGHMEGQLNYSDFRWQWPDRFPSNRDPRCVYEEHNRVVPYTVKYSRWSKTDEPTLARVRPELWYTLHEADRLIRSKQQETGKDVFPLFNVFFDHQNDWLETTKSVVDRVGTGISYTRY